METTVAIIVIGNEILSGKVRDENSPYLVRELRALGRSICHIHVIPDDVDVIAEVVRGAASRFADVITTGGVGPTLDDLTFAGVAQAFQVPLVHQPELERVIRLHLGDHVNANHLRMAYVPEGTEFIWSGDLPWPATRMRNVLVLPGTPELVRLKWIVIRERYRAPPFALRRLYLNLEEGLVAPHLDAVHVLHPGVELGSYPQFDDRTYAVMVTLEAKDAAQVSAALEDLRSRFDPNEIFGVD
jgi:molybdenum cofactor synthesis domain-containing protein